MRAGYSLTILKTSTNELKKNSGLYLTESDSASKSKKLVAEILRDNAVFPLNYCYPLNIKLSKFIEYVNLS